MSAAALATCVLTGLAGVCMWRDASWSHELLLWSRSLSTCPVNAKALNNYGKALQRAGRADEALAHFARAGALDRSFAPAYFNVGLLVQQRGLHRHAVAAYVESLRWDSGYAASLNNMVGRRPGSVLRRLTRAQAASLQALGRHEQAAQALERVRRMQQGPEQSGRMRV